MNSPILLFDTSYCCFYRYHAICNWFKLAHKEIELNYDNISENEVFMSKFHKKFIDMILDIKKKYNIEFDKIIMALDGCNNWRKTKYPDYKANRKNSNSRIYDDQIFKYLLNIIIPELKNDYNIISILEHTAEGDDVIAVIKKYIRKNYPNQEIIIITSDTDLCQLIDDNTKIIDLKNKNLNDGLEKSKLSPSRYLKQKCIIGDKSDNIPPIYPKCGKKTAEKYLNDQDCFEKKLQENNKFRDQYNLNKLLIDLDNIPDFIQESIINTYLLNKQ